MATPVRGLVVLVVLGLCASSARAGGFEDGLRNYDPKAKAIAASLSVATARPGQTVTLLIPLDLAPGFHTYHNISRCRC